MSRTPLPILNALRALSPAD